ncbi:MAG: ATP-dependent Clp protease ATP-binding subunit, partial [Oscillospiraceae bacterium]|nr:ATP-dependent Clp protease ATP-binding subunit [Oscillospiraceae bacterium]
AEALAQRIASGDVLPMLKSKRLLMLDISSVVAGTKYRGDFEQRMNEIIAELEGANDCILFIDELHCIVGAGSSEGSVDAANLLKPALARGRIQLIGATTRKEYTKHIEKDSALERRFLPVYVDEPCEHQAAKMLLRASAKLQLHHRIFIPKELIDRAVALSVRYLPQRRLPDKALDLLDEAAAHCRTKECTESCCTLSEEDLVSVISKWSGVRDIAAFGSNKKLRELNSTLQQHIVGQQHALSVLCEALQRRNSGLADSNRPIGCFLFCGPTGVGKTECARVLANSYFGADALLRFDMSEYSDITAVSRLIGANAGYVGHEEDGQLTEAVRKKPFCVLLMDEIEKADQSVRQLLLQIMDCGKLTDAKGRAADFRNCIFILTCNTAATLLQRGGGIGFAQGECAAQTALQRELQKQFSAEFLARLDEAVPFYPLSESHTQQICMQKCEALCGRARKLGLVLNVDHDAVQLLCQKSSCEQNGARDIARNISRYIELPAAKLLLNRDKESRDAVCITAVDGEFVMLGVQDQLRSCLSTEVPASSAAPITVMTSSGSM